GWARGWAAGSARTCGSYDRESVCTEHRPNGGNLDDPHRRGDLAEPRNPLGPPRLGRVARGAARLRPPRGHAGARLRPRPLRLPDRAPRAAHRPRRRARDGAGAAAAPAGRGPAGAPTRQAPPSAPLTAPPHPPRGSLTPSPSHLKESRTPSQGLGGADVGLCGGCSLLWPEAP